MNREEIKTVGVRAEIWWQIETELSTNSLSNLAVIHTLTLTRLAHTLSYTYRKSTCSAAITMMSSCTLDTHTHAHTHSLSLSVTHSHIAPPASLAIVYS